MAKKTDITWHEHHVSPEERADLAGHKGAVVWFTGLSGCGKSTVANFTDRKLFQLGVRSFVLDGDNIRHGLCASPDSLAKRHGEAFADRFGLGFGAEDREENIRRIASVAELFCSAGVVALVAFVSPYRRDRRAARERVEATAGSGAFVEAFVDAPLELCQSRDPKGLYRKSRAGELAGLTGVDDPYEPPAHPELVLDSAGSGPEPLADAVVAYLQSQGLLGKAGR